MGFAIVIAALVAIAVIQKSETVDIQDALSTHLNDPALTACEPVIDHEDRFSCIVLEDTNRSACNTGTVPITPAPLLTKRMTTLVEAESSCDAINRALEYSATRQHDTDCVAFLETAVSEVPSESEQREHGFLSRLKAKLGKEAVPEGGIPSVIAPDTAFTAGC
jgi:hypothetical protein